MALPTIPDYITVHLGEPSDTSAPNVRIPFIDYIKNESPTDNKELTDLNNKLITEGEKTISIIDEKLKEMGAVPGDKVRIKDFYFDYTD